MPDWKFNMLSLVYLTCSYGKFWIKKNSKINKMKEMSCSLHKMFQGSWKIKIKKPCEEKCGSTVEISQIKSIQLLASLNLLSQLIFYIKAMFLAFGHCLELWHSTQRIAGSQAWPDLEQHNSFNTILVYSI